MNNPVLITLGIVLVTSLTVSSIIPKPASLPAIPECKVNAILAEAVKEYQEETRKAAEHTREMIIMLPRTEQEALAEAEAHSAEVIELKKELLRSKASCPQK